MTKQVNGSIYDQWIQNNKKHFKLPGIEYFGKQYSFEEIDKMIDTYARAFKKIQQDGTKSVTICSPIIPSTIFAFYALNKLGIRVNFVSDILIGLNGNEYIDNNDTETLIILDRFYPKVAEELSKTNLKNVIIASLGDDTHEPVKQALGGDSIYQQIKETPGSQKYTKLLSIEELVELGKTDDSVITSNYNPGQTAVILYTGGSTGIPKGVEITNEGMANMYNICLQQGYDYVPGDRNLCIIPPNHPTSFVHCLVTPWLYGTTQVLQPIYDKNRFASDLKDLKVQYAMGAASHYATLIDSELKEGDLSHLKWAFCGGEPVSYELASNINEVFERTGVQNPQLALAYGMSELGPMCMLSYKTKGLVNKVGKVVPGVKARIRDINTGEIVGAGKRGTLEIKTPCRMKGYFKKPELTESFFTEDGFGITGDIAIMDEDGNYEVLGRVNDSFIAPNNSVVYLFDIENFVYQDDAIKEAEVVKYETEDGSYVPAVHMVLKPEYKGREAEVINRVQTKCEALLGQYEIPAGYKVRDCFGTNPASAKRDYLSLLEERDGFYRVNAQGYLEEVTFPKSSSVKKMEKK